MIEPYRNSRVDQIASFSRGFLEFRFQYWYGTHQATLSISRRAFLSLERRESRNSSAHRFLSNTVSPGFVTEHGNCSRIANVCHYRILGSRRERVLHVQVQKKSSVEASFTRTRECRCTEKTRLYEIIDTFQTENREFAIVQVDLIDTTITPKFRNVNNANTRWLFIVTQACLKKERTQEGKSYLHTLL